MFAQVLGELEQISRQLVPAALDGRSAAGLFNDAARAERLCTAIKSRLGAVVPLEDDGRTELDNLWRLCSHHHRLKTYEGWKVVGRNGTRDLVPP